MGELVTTIPLMLITISLVWATESQPCGQLTQYNIPQLWNSKPSRIWPWHAAIFRRSSYECGGTLISENWILTAGHCVTENEDPVKLDEISVLLGRLNLTANESRSEQSFKAIEIIVHEEYFLVHLQNDIALVRLSQAATFNQFVQPICLWRADETDLSYVVDKYGTVVGWGKTETYNNSDILQEAHLKVVTHGRCIESNRRFNRLYLTENNFCAGLRNVVVGKNQARKKKTDVAMYLDWIDDNMEVDCQTIVQCSNDSNWSTEECKVNVPSKFAKRTCEIIFDERSNSAAITSLIIDGEMESIHNISDAIIKFANLEILHLNSTNLKVLDKPRLAVFTRIKELDLSHNQIAELKRDTFDDLKELRVLSLHNNSIEELHPDVFNELHNLRELYLGENKLNELPQGLIITRIRKCVLE